MNAKSMTVNQMIKALQKIKDDGGGKQKVSVHKGSLWDGNDTFEICEISQLTSEWVYLADGDGGVACTKSGRERGSVQVVLYGHSMSPSGEKS